MLAVQATGRVVRDKRGLELIVTRVVPAPLAETWSWLTTPKQLKKWLGAITILDSSALTRFRADVGGNPVEFSLVEVDGGTRVFVSQRMLRSREAGQFGPEWEFRLDSLIAAVAGTTTRPATDYLTQRPYYERLAMDGDPEAWPAR